MVTLLPSETINQFILKIGETYLTQVENERLEPFISLLCYAVINLKQEFTPVVQGLMQGLS
jgi:hypothetical protein